MLEEDEDTHLCIKCNTTIVKLENYILHRKNQCGKSVSNATELNREIIDTNHSYRSFEFSEPPSAKHEKQFNFNYGIESAVVHTEHDDDVPTNILPSPMHQSEKVNDYKADANKSLSDSYDYSYGLGADVFFSSLNLQSSSKLKTQNVATNVSAEGTTNSLVKNTDKLLQRKQLDPGHLTHGEQIDDWINTAASTSGTDKLMKAVDSISGTKKPAYDSYNYEYDDDDEDEMAEVEDLVEDDAPPSSHTGGKWKPSERNHHSMHSASRWYERWDIPEENNQLGLASATAASSSHEDLVESYPSPNYTRGKWVPGTKIIKLDYKHKARHDSETFSEQFWCNFCNRKLSSRVVYERHLLSKLHTKRSQPESELEQAQLPLPSIEEIVEKKWLLATDNPSRRKRKRKDNIEFIQEQPFDSSTSTKRKRRFNYVKCSVCNTRLKTALYGKHLISHYHYRRMFKKPSESYATILENIHRIVLQSPYQCQPCRFYANTEEMFLRHWCSDEHSQTVSTTGRFWCAFCKFICDTNDEMRLHLIDTDHQEVVNAINRSVPIIIRKKSPISCDKCAAEFTLNIELRKHAIYCSAKALGTASDQYQGKHYCATCNEYFQSIISFQRHASTVHSTKSYFCGPCEITFTELEAAKRHRVSAEHKVKAARITAKKSLARKCTVCGAMLDDLLVLKQHLKEVHPEHNYSCYFCGQKFILPQELSRHIRDKACKTNEKYQSEEACNDDAESFSEMSLLELPIITDVEVPKLIDTSHNETTKSVDMDTSAAAAAAAVVEENYMIIEHDSELSLDVSTQSKTEQNHSTTTEQSILWGCKQCDFRTPTEAECIFHEMLHKWEICKNNKIPCPLCNRTFGKNSLRCHLRLHTNERIFKCDHCDMKFTRKANLKDHIQRIHLKKFIAKKPSSTSTSASVKRSALKSSTSTQDNDKRLFGCTLCERQFRKKSLLEQHMHCHREMVAVRAFDCVEKDCLFRGRSAAELRVHQSTHSEEKNFCCTMPNCSYKTKTNTLLKRHIKMQHADTAARYQCSHCEFSTKISSHLKRHNRIHTGSKPYKCPHCSYVSNNPENLRKHVLKSNKHLGRFLYECKLCSNASQSFATNNTKEYKSHLVTVHKEENDAPIKP